MRKKQFIAIPSIVVALVVAAVTIWLFWPQKEGEQQVIIKHPTDNVEYFEDQLPHADSLIVGKWQNTANPQWYKIYLDDFDEEARLFWGKEWDESEQVYEEDLNYHGNGWFRWEKVGNKIREYAGMDIMDAYIPKVYHIRLSNSDSLVYYEKEYKKCIFRFARVSR